MVSEYMKLENQYNFYMYVLIFVFVFFHERAACMFHFPFTDTFWGPHFHLATKKKFRLPVGACQKKFILDPTIFRAYNYYQ